MAVTAKGTPYVESSDLVANYPGTSLALANHIDDTAGKVLQVVSVTKTDTFSASVAAGANTAITGLSVTITPQLASSKVLIFGTVFGRGSNQNGFNAALARGSTLINLGDAAGSRSRAGGAGYVDTTFHVAGIPLMFLDSPATTAATTYNIYAINLDIGTRTVFVNRSENDSDTVNYVRTSSVITVMEISA